MTKFWKSKTIVIGLLSVVAGIITYLQGQVETGSVITIEGILMIILRTITKESLGAKK